MHEQGFYWIAFLGSDDRPFEPIIAWWTGEVWWVPGSAKPAGAEIGVRVLSAALNFADRPLPATDDAATGEEGR